MPKGVTTKGYKMTQGRKRILELLAEEGGEIRSRDGQASSMMYNILDAGTSMAALYASLRELDNIGLITRDVESKRTYAIGITDLGYEAIGLERPAAAEPKTTPPEATEPEATPTAVSEEQWEWSDSNSNGEVDITSISDQIDYEVLLGLFVKAALRGLEGPSNSELDYYKQQNELLTRRVEVLEAEVEKFRAEAASAIGERDQLQKNLNMLMARSESNRVGRGTDPIRKLLKPDERAALDALMRQVPTRRGD